MFRIDLVRTRLRRDGCHHILAVENQAARAGEPSQYLPQRLAIAAPDVGDQPRPREVEAFGQGLVPPIRKVGHEVIEDSCLVGCR